MAAPSTLTISVDLDEYSRFESDKDTITVSVSPSIAFTSLAVAAAPLATTVTVIDGSIFPASFPYPITIGAGATQETVTLSARVGNVLTVTALVNAHIIGEKVFQVVSFAGEQVSVQLIKARRNRDVEVATKQLTLSGGTLDLITFYLPDILDSDAAPKARRGSYFVQATSITDPLVVGKSADFLISLISLDRFKKEYLHGADRFATNMLAVHAQPSTITGVTITSISPGHTQGFVPLSYNYSSDNSVPVPNITRLLSWCGGPAVSVVPGKTRYLLRKGNSSTDYVEVTIPSASAMPNASTTEDILIEKSALDDKALRSMLEDAISWVEQSEIFVYLEPTTVVTMIPTNDITYDAGSDIPKFVSADWDQRVDALTYIRPSAGHWISFRCPYFPLIRFDELFGQVSNTRIIDIALQWVEAHEKGGFVELVPFSQEVSFNFIGLVWVESLRGPIPIPNFWNFTARVGFRDTPRVLLELVAKKAARDALILIGQAFRPGFASQSLSRDGISESVSYGNMAQFGIFTATINFYTQWINENSIKLRGAFRGVNLAVL